MSLKHINYLDELISLNLPKWKYAIAWSWPMAVRWIKKLDWEIRVSNDIDVIVSSDLREELIKKYEVSWEENHKIVINWWHVELYRKRRSLPWKLQEMIDTADEIYWFSFVSLNHVIEFKKKLAEWKDWDKHRNDILSIQHYLLENNDNTLKVLN